MPSRLDLIGRCFRMPISGWGRASRREFWSFFLLVVIATIAVFLLEFELINPGGNEPSAFFAIAAASVLCFMGVPLFFVGLRRYHDIDRSGWLYVLHMFSGFGTAFAFYAMLAKSYPYDNKHGPVPPEARRKP